MEFVANGVCGKWSLWQMEFVANENLKVNIISWNQSMKNIFPLLNIIVDKLDATALTIFETLNLITVKL
jgi:hypothetical protein